MPRSSETLLRLVTPRRIMAELNVTSLSVSDTQVLDRIIRAFSREAADLMGGAIYKKSRVEVLDVKPGQRIFQLAAWPIDTTTAPALVYNASIPRDFTDSNDAVDSDYVRCDADSAERGEVELDLELSPGRGVLQVTYTGGLASYTGSEGIDGVSTQGAGTFTSASSLFQTDGVAANYKLVIESGADAGTHTISTVDSQTQITTSSTFAGQTSAPFHILDTNSESLITDWEEVVDAMTNAVVGFWRRRGGHDQVVTESAGGTSVNFLGPYNLPNRSREQFAGMRKRYTF